MMRGSRCLRAAGTRGGVAWIAFALAAALLLASPREARAQNAAAAHGFDGFKLVRTRNIFDPDRRPPSSQIGSSGAPVAPIVRSDYLALTGTLVSNDKSLAFFSGSRPDFDKVLPVKEQIAGQTITRITHGSVTLERAGKPVTIAVGWTVPLNGGASAPAPAAPVTADTLSSLVIPGGAAGAPPAARAAPGIPVPGSTTPAATPNPDVARMMRERRLQEMQ